MARGDIKNLDPFDAPVPGQGMTGAPGQYPWERPSRISKPEDAAMSIISKLENDPEAEGTILNLMASGIPIENLVGKAQFIFFSLENSRFFEIWKWPNSIRFERLMNKIK